MKYNLKAFTLVELIVVITIVGILSTIGFVSYSGYLVGARDASRVSQVTKLSDALQVYETTRNLPLPDDYIDITASGTLVGYQGYVGVDVQEALDFTNGGKDPKDDKYYTYYLSEDRSNFQLLAYMEEPEGISFSIFDSTHAVDYTERFMRVFGQKLGVLTQSITNIPAQEVVGVSSVDLVSENTNSYIAHISNDEQMEGMGTVLKESIPNASCKRIKQSGKAGANGIYTINPEGNGKLTVYCDMENAGGGWTLVGRSAANSTTGNIGWGSVHGTPANEKVHYSMGARTEDIPFSKIMVARYIKKKNIDYAVTFDVDDADLDTSSAATFATSNCQLVIDSGLTTAEKTWSHCHRFGYWGGATRGDTFFFRPSSSIGSNGLQRSEFNGWVYDSANGAWEGKQAMVFVK